MEEYFSEEKPKNPNEGEEDIPLLDIKAKPFKQDENFS